MVYYYDFFKFHFRHPFIFKSSYSYYFSVSFYFQIFIQLLFQLICLKSLILLECINITHSFKGKGKKIRRNQFCKSNTKKIIGNTQKHPVVQKLQHYPWDKLAISYKAYSTESQQGCPSVYLLVSYMYAQIRVWSCLVTDNFGLFTEIVNSCVVGGRMA